jgi:acetyl esterase/lipase
MGFSAGGEVAALAATASTLPPMEQPTKSTGRAISQPSRRCCIQPPADMKLSKDTPPAFLACGENDRQNIAQGLPELYLALKRAGASAELHVYAGVGHGFGLRDRT